jgi:CelD/BcsL family acetyltransferase involved in cellulose biosynthesis
MSNGLCLHIVQARYAQAITIETSMSYPPDDDRPVTYHAYRELPLVEAFSEEWDRLLQSTTCNRAFSCATWFLSACKADSSISPCVIAAWRGLQLVGVLPLVEVPGTRKAEFATPSDYNDIIARPEDDLIIDRLLEYALGLGKTLSLKHLRLDSNFYRAAAHARPEFLEKQFHTDRTCFYIDLDVSYDHYLASRSKNLRADLRRHERKARQDGVTVMPLTPEDFSPELLPEVFLSLNFSRFQDGSGFRRPARQAFVRAAFPEVFRQGRLKPFALIAAGKVIALDVCLAGPRGLGTWNGGFLPEAEKYAPGTLLVAEELRHCFALGMEEYDWLQGQDSYKTRWATGSRATGRIDFAPCS